MLEVEYLAGDGDYQCLDTANAQNSTRTETSEEAMDHGAVTNEIAVADVYQLPIQGQWSTPKSRVGGATQGDLDGFADLKFS